LLRGSIVQSGEVWFKLLFCRDFGADLLASRNRGRHGAPAAPQP
jgi:hypothetical protein